MTGMLDDCQRQIRAFQPSEGKCYRCGRTGHFWRDKRSGWYCTAHPLIDRERQQHNRQRRESQHRDRDRAHAQIAPTGPSSAGMSYAHAAMATQPDDTKERDDRKEKDLAELRDRVKQQEKEITALKEKLAKVQHDAQMQLEKAVQQQTKTLNELSTLSQQHAQSIHKMHERQDLQSSNQKGTLDRLRETETESDRRTHTLQLFCIKLARALIKKQHPPHEYFDELVPFMLTYYPFVAAGTTSFIELDRAINQHALQMKEKREKEKKEADKKERGRIEREQRETERKEKQRKDKEQKEREAHEQKEKEHVQLEKEQKEREEREQKEKEQKESAEREKESKEHARKEAEPRAVQQTPSQTPNATATLSKQKTVTSASETSAEVRTSNTDRSPAQQASRDREQLGKRAGPSVAATGATEKRSERHRKQSAKAQAAAAGSA